MKQFIPYILFACLIFATSGCQKTISSGSGTGTLKITFKNTVNGSPMVMNTTNYTNPFGESYTITKFRYYITNLSVNGADGPVSENSSYHLIDESIPGSLSFEFNVEENTFSGIGFLLGVDSLHNVSGAQTGALDPLNDMFWTWNSGYVMAKMEGTAPLSNQFGNKIEYHIGGFKGADNVLKQVSLNFPAGKSATIKAGGTSEILINADFNSWWQTPNDLKITNLPVCTTPGPQAKQIADNYSKMFSVTNIVNN